MIIDLLLFNNSIYLMPNKNCKICSKSFWTKTIGIYCSNDCLKQARKIRENKKYRENIEKYRQNSLKSYYRNKEKVLQRSKEWYVENRERILIQKKDQYKSDLEKYRKLSRENKRKPNIVKARKLWLKKKLSEDPDYFNRASRKRHQKHKDKRNAYSKMYYLENSERIKKQVQEWNKTYSKKPEVKERKRAYTNKIRKIPQIKIAHQYRSRINQALNLKGLKKIRGKLDFLGCSLEEFKIYLESKFKPGMNWSNYKWDGWHVDHIKPVSSFDLTKEEDFKKCFHYTNLQPLWAYENFKKSDKY